jgi:hypothetical protein
MSSLFAVLQCMHAKHAGRWKNYVTAQNSTFLVGSLRLRFFCRSSVFMIYGESTLLGKIAQMGKFGIQLKIGMSKGRRASIRYLIQLKNNWIVP